MVRYHAVMLGECHEEFSVTVEADSLDEAYKQLGEDYPESCCVQIDSPADRKRREHQLDRDSYDEDY